MVQRYLIALGSNAPHHRHGRPERVLAAALDALREQGLAVTAASRIVRSAPVGPSRRRYANAAALIETRLSPDRTLNMLKGIEAQFGRRSGGQQWTSRVIDLDIVLWSGGAWAAPDLVVPHMAFRVRDFVLTPLIGIAAQWRDPLTRLTVRQLRAQLRKAKRQP
ncbi:2-amino-4-hydroxy-6-hydroxymethyldihydropteridine diphosphokinase [Novosphingobium sp.]|uniref:2-amino-4-hydroxy-6- hydroxymethyldihydropteridine diphosphokinase n=1 Tax=Novosphingobium sp. TaxID=1874826 RepID=UPI0026007C49|nr:2-amino-4-hydroxy-6-hydroxymethyldihydropteridine diphosphokinase [Novosphingobium sp.]